MTYLQLFKRFLREAGYTGDTPTTVDSQSGDRLQALDWINDAYIDIQSHQTTWRFMEGSFSFTTTADTREYSVSTIGLTDHERWIINTFGDARVYLTSTGVSGEQYLDYLYWDLYRQTYLFGARRSETGFPRVIAIHPDNSLDLYPTPGDIYTITGKYYKKPVELSGDSDEPVFPSQFHTAIIWRALMLYGAFYAANEKYEHGQNEYRKIIRRMQFDQLPKMTFGAPLV